MATREARREGLRDVSTPRKLQEHTREAYQHAQALGSTLEQAVDEVGGLLRENLERRPYVTLATAAGTGYVLGGGIPPRLIALLFGLGSRLAIDMFIRELVGAGTSSGAAARGMSGHGAGDDRMEGSPS